MSSKESFYNIKPPQVKKIEFTHEESVLMAEKAFVPQRGRTLKTQGQIKLHLGKSNKKITSGIGEMFSNISPRNVQQEEIDNFYKTIDTNGTIKYH